jgi:hypothetical protein
VIEVPKRAVYLVARGDVVTDLIFENALGIRARIADPADRARIRGDRAARHCGVADLIVR